MIFTLVCRSCESTVRKRRTPSQLRRSGVPQYCSQQCHGDARRGTGRGLTPNQRYDCEQCGVSCWVYRSPSAPAPRFCSLPCLGRAQRGETNPSYSGGRHFDLAGYLRVLAPEHHAADPRGYVYEHRLVMERELGRALTDEEVVHHRNRVKDDNRPQNLLLLASQAEHMRLHREEDAVAYAA